MADIKQKPKSDAPKVKSRDAFLPREAGRMLAQEYQKAAQERSESPGRPEHEGVRRVEDGIHSAVDRGSQFAKKSIQNAAHKKSQIRRNAARPSQAGQHSSGDFPESGTDAGAAPHVRQTDDRSYSQNTQATEGTGKRQKQQQVARRQSVRKSKVQAQGKERAALQEVQMRSGSQQAYSGSGSKGTIAGSSEPKRTIKQKSMLSNSPKEKPARQVFSLKSKKGMAAAQKPAVVVEKTKRRAAAVKQAAATTKKAAQATVHAAKRIATIVAKAAAALGKAILAAISAGGPVLLIFIIVAGIAAVLASPFGIFFSGEDEESKSKMQQVVAAISYDYNQNIHDIIGGNAHDEMRMEFINHGYKRADNWIDVLAVFAVKTADMNGGADVTVLDDANIEKLRAVFWDMQNVTHEVKNEQKYDAETDTYSDYYVLYIRAECIGAWTMADTYGFNTQQREILTEMLSGEYDDYFAEMIGSAGLFLAIGDGSGVVGNGNFIWPSAASNYVTSRHGSRIHPITGKRETHLGIDIGAGAGTSVLASDAGSVISNSVDSSYGIHLLIDHGNGYRTLYAHMSAAHVGVGDAVEQGQVIGLVGSTGTSTNPHLHFEIRANGSPIDPLPFFDNYTLA